MLYKLVPYKKIRDDEVALNVLGQMCADGEMEDVVESPNNWIRSIDEAIYCKDEKGPWIFATCKSWLDGAIFGIWIRSDKRHTREMVYAACEIYESALLKYPILIGYTKKPLSKIHQKMGYKLSGKIPGLWDGKDLEIWTLKREDFVDWRIKLWGINK